jgi:polysaccharide export outer membrane protein
MKMKISITDLQKHIFFIFISLFFISCGSKEDVVYFQGVDSVGSSRPIVNYVPVIRPDDMLTITVSALDLDAVRPFNLQSVAFTDQDGQSGRTALQTYLVDPNGNINFPVLGSLKLAGLNRNKATTLVTDLLKEYIKNPMVNIRTVNFKVTVLGEVNRPGSYTIQNERITILEAIGLAGDMRIQAERKNVLVVREDNGKKTYHRVNMTSEEVFNSPVYYLTQNDVIYVEPNSSRVKSSTVGPNVGATLSVITTLITTAAFLVSVTR